MKMERATKRRAIADKLAADIPRLTQEIADRRANLQRAKERSLSKPRRCAMTAGWFDAWSRHIGPLARAVGALGRVTKRLPEALDRADEAQRRARQAAELHRRIERANVGLIRRLDRAREETAGLMERWQRERAGEARRLKSRRRELEKRTHFDSNEPAEWKRRPPVLPPPVEQPTFADELEDEAAPPREGLIPGTFRVIDPARLRGGLLDAPPLPSIWTWQHVGARLIEAHAIIRRLPGSVLPKGYGGAWPAYRHQAGELAIQAGAGTLAMGRNVIVRTATADEVARANEAIGWPMQFLSAFEWAAVAVNTWAMREDAEPEANGPEHLLKVIADALNSANEVVR